MIATTAGIIPGPRVPTAAEMVPDSAQSALAHLELPRGLMLCVDCEVTWLAFGNPCADYVCWCCGKGQGATSVKLAEDALGKPIIPRLGPGVARQDMALSEGDYCLEIASWARSSTVASAALEGRVVPAGFERSPEAQQFLDKRKAAA